MSMRRRNAYAMSAIRAMRITRGKAIVLSAPQVLTATVEGCAIAA